MFYCARVLNFPSQVFYEMGSLFFCTVIISSVRDADLLARLTRFTLIGACLLRTDKNSAFHVEKFIFESVCENLKFSVSV